jgi:hypothetical protein
LAKAENVFNVGDAELPEMMEGCSEMLREGGCAEGGEEESEEGLHGWLPGERVASLNVRDTCLGEKVDLA